MVRELDIDLIWSTAPPLSALYLGQQIAQRTGVPHVVDVRDVQGAVEPSTATRQQRSWIEAEQQALRSAAGVTYVTPPQLDVLCGKYPWFAEKRYELIYNWFLAEEIAGCKPKKFAAPTILHGGSLYGGMRRLDGFFEGLAQLRNSASSTGAHLRFLQLSANYKDVEYLSELKVRLGLEDVVECRPALPRRDFLSACLGAQILLLAVGHDRGHLIHKGAIPGKLYDYFAAARPILVVGPEDCEAGKLVRRLNRGMAVRSDRPQETADAIQRLLAGEGHSGKLDLSAEAVKEFESSVAVQKMAGFLERVCST